VPGLCSVRLFYAPTTSCFSRICGGFDSGIPPQIHVIAGFVVGLILLFPHKFMFFPDLWWVREPTAAEVQRMGGRMGIAPLKEPAEGGTS
ncbi:MAG: hypothetical protein MJ148_01730, partial [Clostridia bacterium]|nr:hypothetical protein [Clostridia bacterium]